MNGRPHHCNRPMHGHGWDRQLFTPRRRYRCPTCGRVEVEDPTRNPNGTRGQTYTDDRGRLRVYLGQDHPHANSGGWQYLYRHLVATSLGRALRSDEHIHHVDGNHQNNQAENLELITPEYHGRTHASAMLVARSENGRFTEASPAAPFRWPRRGAILGNAAESD